MKKIAPVFVSLLFLVTTIFAQRISQNKAVIFKATSTECNVCGLRAWDEMKDAIDLYESDAVIMAVHPLEESLLYTPTSEALMENVPQFFGTPTFYVNNENLPFLWLGEARLRIEAFQERQVVAHPFIEYAIEDDQVRVAINTVFLRRTNRAHYVAAYLVEDEVDEFQNNRGPEDRHSKIVRTHLGEDVFGTLLSEEEIEVNQEFATNYTFELDPEKEWVTENLEIAVIIWEKSGDRFTIVNSNFAHEPTSLSTSLNRLVMNQVNLAIQPTIVENMATVQLETPIALSDLKISVLNAMGQELTAIFNGNLQAGNHVFTVDRSAIATSGLYFLVAEEKGSRLVEKMIFR